jgi:peptide/nickel transport system ATP-binding protein
VTIQAQILHEAQQLCAKTGTAMVWITHDLAIVSALADRIAVMYAGRIVEAGTTAEIVARPLHPYTKGLIGSVPSANQRGQRLRQIPGMTPSVINLPVGCAFASRCDQRGAGCDQDQTIRELDPGRNVRCCRPLLAEVIS